MIKLDYTVQTPEERNELVKEILANAAEDEINDKYLEILADYLILCMEKQEKKEKKILTDNRMMTVNKRETSFEGLVSQLENGEDGIYGMISNDKNTIFQPKVLITKKDVEEIPLLKQLRDTINTWEARLKITEGKRAYGIKHALIEMRKDQYLIKNAYQRPIVPNKLTRSKSSIRMDENIDFDENGFVVPSGVSFMNPKVVSMFLCDYSRLKQDSYGVFDNDTYYMIYDIEKLIDSALAPYPVYQKIVEYKIDGMPNLEIKDLLQAEFGFSHSIEYISSLWRNKIPKLIASAAEDQYLNWYYTFVEKGKFKKCSRCGEIKLAHNKYFSKNKTSKDGFYSICKECRNKRAKELNAKKITLKNEQLLGQKS